MRVSLRVPVKRSGALVATNPAGNSRPELIADDEMSVILPARSSARDRDLPAGGGRLRFRGGFQNHIGPIDSVMPKKTHIGAPRYGCFQLRESSGAEGIVANALWRKNTPAYRPVVWSISL